MSDDAEHDDLLNQARGRAKFLKDLGEIKTSDLIYALIAEIEMLRPEPIGERPPDRICFYKKRQFKVSQGYSGAIRFELDTGGLLLGTDNILDILNEIEERSDDE